MATSEMSAVPGSERNLAPGAVDEGPRNPDEQVELTVVLKPHAAAVAVPAAAVSSDVKQHEYVTRQELASTRGSDPDAVDRIRTFAAEHGLTVEGSAAGPRTLRLSGSVAAVNDAFGVDLHTYAVGDETYRGRTGSVHLPPELVDDVEAVLGLDNRTQVRHGMRRSMEQDTFPGYPPAEIAGFYGFPTSITGEGQCIGIAEFGGGFQQADLNAYCTQFNLTQFTPAVVPVDGSSNNPGPDPDSDGEVMLDIEVIHSVAPDAKVVVYFAPNSSDGFVDAITAAVNDTVNRPSVLSISWGGPEGSGWTSQSVTALESALSDAAAIGLTVLAASGDDGSRNYVDDGAVHVNYPASSPQVLACGGSRITVNGDTITTEVVWNDGLAGGAAGGGISDLFPVPSWQQGTVTQLNASTNGTGRGVPDIAADASPASGFLVRLNGGKEEPIGGTSAVAPLMAGLLALANANLGKPVGFVNAALYAHPQAFNDIQTESNDITGGQLPGYDAGPGWDPASGLGSPQGQTLIQQLTT
jgi:kumamolisin